MAIEETIAGDTGGDNAGGNAGCIEEFDAAEYAAVVSTAAAEAAAAHSNSLSCDTGEGSEDEAMEVLLAARCASTPYLLACLGGTFVACTPRLDCSLGLTAPDSTI